jgi:hypothetical protein
MGLIEIASALDFEPASGAAARGEGWEKVGEGRGRSGLGATGGFFVPIFVPTWQDQAQQDSTAKSNRAEMSILSIFLKRGISGWNGIRTT